MILHVRHTTRYRYPGPAQASHNEVRLEPLSDTSQELINFKLDLSPNAKTFRYLEVGGPVHNFYVGEPHQMLEITALSTVTTRLDNPFLKLDLLAPPGQDWVFYEEADVRSAYCEYLAPTPFVGFHPKAVAMGRAAKRGSAMDTLLAVNTGVHDSLSYQTGATDVHSTLDAVLADHAGVCQDFAHLMLATTRSLGIPSRYVSGYLYVAPNEHGMRGELATHAWVECLFPDERWHAFDPTNNVMANDHHVRVHLGRDYADVTPTRGVYVGPPSESLEVEVEVEAVSGQFQMQST
jgi:transglutaminase-like putative cysteine protease